MLAINLLAVKKHYIYTNFYYMMFTFTEVNALIRSFHIQTQLQNQMEANKSKMLTKYLEKQRRVRENIMLELQRGPSKVSVGRGWRTLHIVLAAYCCMCVKAPTSSQRPLVYIVYRPQLALPRLTGATPSVEWCLFCTLPASVAEVDLYT